MDGMKARTILLVCLVLTLGALYGRFQFLRDRGFIRRDASFLDYVMRRDVTKPEGIEPAEPGGEEPEQSTPTGKKSEEPAAPTSQPPSATLYFRE